MVGLAKRGIVTIAFVVFAHATLSDEVVVKNSDRLTGVVITTREGYLILRPSYAGDIDIALAEI